MKYSLKKKFIRSNIFQLIKTTNLEIYFIFVELLSKRHYLLDEIFTSKSFNQKPPRSVQFIKFSKLTSFLQTNFQHSTSRSSSTYDDEKNPFASDNKRTSPTKSTNPFDPDSPPPTRQKPTGKGKTPSNNPFDLDE